MSDSFHKVHMKKLNKNSSRVAPRSPATPLCSLCVRKSEGNCLPSTEKRQFPRARETRPQKQLDGRLNIVTRITLNRAASWRQPLAARLERDPMRLPNLFVC